MDFIPDPFFMRLRRFVLQYAAACFLCLCVVVFAVIDTSLISVRNIRNILSDAAPLLVSASAMALCLFSGYIDFSAGASACFASAIASSFMQAPESAGRMFAFLPPFPAFAVIPFVTILFFAVGMFNGFLIKRVSLPPWFATFATGSVLTALTHIYLCTKDMQLRVLEGFTRQYTLFGVGYIGVNPTLSIPISVIFSLFVFFALRAGIKRFLPEADAPGRSVVQDLKKTMFLFGTVSSLFALSGMMITARAGSIASLSAGEFELHTLAVCFTASLSLFGARGSWAAVAACTFIYSAFMYTADFVGINRFVTLTFRTLIPLTMVWIDIVKRKKTANTGNSGITGANINRL